MTESNTTVSRGKRALAAAVLLAVAASLLTVTALGGIEKPSPAAAAPGNPGVPSAGELIFRESFSEETVSDDPIDIRDYIGYGGMTYYADPAWTPDAEVCNGWILNNDSPMAHPGSDPDQDCQRGSAWGVLKAMAAQMGVAQGMTPAEAHFNKVLSAYTNSDDGSQDAGVVLRTASTLQGHAGRFYSVSAQLSAMYCGSPSAHPAFRFTLFVDGSPNIVTEGLNPCIGSTEEIGIATLYSEAYQAQTNATLGFELYNAKDTGTGNDVALDIPSIFDVTPQLDKAFVPAEVVAGGITKLTFTITNTSDLEEKSGWGFTDNLSTGLVVASNPNIGGTCTAATVATAGGTQIAVTNGTIAAGQASCTITVDVTTANSSARATFQNCAANLSDVWGVDLPDCASVRFIGGSLTIQTDLPSGRVNAGDQFGQRGFDWAPGDQGAAGDALGPAVTTAGSSSGVQAQRFGPVEVAPGQSYRIQQTFSPTGARNHYTTNLQCSYDDGGTEVVLLDTALSDSPASGVRYGMLDFPMEDRDIVCTFTHSLITGVIGIYKYDREDYDADPQILTLLGGAQFQLWRDVDGDGQLDKSIDSPHGAVQTTDPAGPLMGRVRYNTGIVYGATYFAEEVAPPAGYDFVNAQHWVPIVWDEGSATARADVTDPRLVSDGTVAWEKIDASAPVQHLSGSEWRLSGPGGAQIDLTDCAVAPTDPCPIGSNDQDKRQGYFSVAGLDFGAWSLVETKAPAGFRLDPTPRAFNVSVAAPDYVFASPITNVQQGIPAIPLTGGIGELIFLLAGGGAGLVLLALILIRWRRLADEQSAAALPGEVATS